MADIIETKSKGLNSFKKNRENPFVEKAIEDINVVKKTQMMRTNNRTEIQRIVNDNGEVTGHSAFMRFIEVDDEKFAKLYISQFTAFWELSKPAIRVFSYILTKLKPSKDKFEFFYDECLEYTKYNSLQPIYNGLVALCENNIIARGYNENVYFVNPLMVFNGDRVTFAKTFIRKKKEDNPNQLQIFTGEENIKNFEEED
jgi:intergrase/recombinase